MATPPPPPLATHPPYFPVFCASEGKECGKLLPVAVCSSHIIALLSPGLTVCPPRRFHCIACPSQVYTASVIGAPVTRILDLSTAVLWHISQSLQDADDAARASQAMQLSLVSELLMLAGRVPHNFGPGYVLDEDTQATTSSTLAVLLQYYTLVYTHLFHSLHTVPKSSTATDVAPLHALLFREATLSNLMTVIAKWAPEKFKLQYLFFGSLNFLATWTHKMGSGALDDHCHSSGLICYALNCINNLLSLCTGLHSLLSHFPVQP